MEAFPSFIGHYPVTFHDDNVAEVTVKILGKEEKLYVMLSEVNHEEKVYQMQTHVFGHNNLVNASGESLSMVLTRLKNRAGDQGNLNNRAPNWTSWQVQQDNGLPYEKDLNKWIQKIEVSLNRLLGGKITTGPNMIFSKKTVAIIGLGGTGSRIAELIGKTPHKKIILIDNDEIADKNLYRLNASRGEIGKSKVDFAKSQIHLNSDVEVHKVTIQNFAEYYELSDIDFAIIAVDNKEAREFSKELFKSNGIKFLDAAIGITQKEEKYRFSSRVSTESDNNEIIYEDDAYRKNIQIAEINALNAAQTVIRYKELFGFYLSWDDKNRVTIRNNWDISKKD